MLPTGRAPLAVGLAFFCWLLGAGAGGTFCSRRSPREGASFSFQASDGRRLLSATGAPGSASLRGCRLSNQPGEVAAFLRRCRALGEGEADPGPSPSLEEAQAACLGGVASATGGPPRRRAKRGFTYPGTLWCGAGDNAGSYEELGEHRETDRCCRDHDHCQHVIHPFTYKYGYRNLRWHTISHCDCDSRLKACLRSVNDTASRVVGQAFFNVIQVPCFQFTYKEQCVEPYLYVWCKNYSTVAVAVVQDPAMYEYGGEVIDGPAFRQPSVSAPPSGHLHPPASSATPPRPPDKPGGPGSSGKKHREGKGKRRKGKKGKGLKKRKKETEAKARGPPGPLGDLATVSPKWLAARELGKAGFHGLDLGEEDPFNAILGDDPGEGASLRFGPEGAWVESREPVPPNPLPRASSAVGPSRKKRKDRRHSPATKKRRHPRLRSAPS